MANKKTFEENLDDLEAIVKNLESGQVPLEEALEQFQTGIKLTQQLEVTLNKAQSTLTKVMNDAGEEVPFEISDHDVDSQQPNDTKTENETGSKE
ncbi:exodeoxyribonuclease VII small subunit [Agrilactobacillus fermenti]|uniref:exodeoxyribonuclease VII small subunit n=1 Tax=Agrilactobacillus fermenti TaxID=2586909 RepID=UPI001E5395BD|nr:exodeoxyribonuclease VII small subunit [Agrilactobacillus fermenti]MCD2256209.1 exodeoxyribonuclease VII small subunit [Agrilactobacillus fermenti]